MRRLNFWERMISNMETVVAKKVKIVPNSRNVDLMIERALEKAPYVKEGETGRTGADAGHGYMIYIEYHTAGKVNVCDYHERMTSEHFDWKMHGCKNNEEWRRFLNKQFWRGL